jgi:cation transport ATPase
MTVEVIMLTGDNEKTASCSRSTSSGRFKAGMPPEDPNEVKNFKIKVF